MSRPRKYPEELLERGVRLALESGRPIAHVARDLGINSEVLRKRVHQAEADQGLRPDLPASEKREEIKRLRRENFERRANEILKAASVFSPRNSTQTDRGEPLRRRAAWPVGFRN
jgi:transposase